MVSSTSFSHRYTHRPTDTDTQTQTQTQTQTHTHTQTHRHTDTDTDTQTQTQTPHMQYLTYVHQKRRSRWSLRRYLVLTDSSSHLQPTNIRSKQKQYARVRKHSKVVTNEINFRITQLEGSYSHNFQSPCWRQCVLNWRTLHPPRLLHKLPWRVANK